jgi:tRNA 2-selenouridine synthase
MVQKISVQEALKMPDAVFIDTRSPAEFEEDHLPNALNLPILSNEERAIVGTIYKQVSQDKAIDVGVSYISQKLPSFLRVLSTLKEKNIIVNCWRGGLRSKSIAAFFEPFGYKMYQLEGGYKAYRAYIKERLYNYDFKPDIIILHGLTCTGKTALLKQFPNSLDLEDLAQHRSSLYGALGLKPNSQKRFESLLLQRLDQLNQEKFVLVEGESRRIGDVIIPELLWNKMNAGKNILITRTLDTRAQALVDEYLDTPEKVSEFKEISQRLWKVISKENKQKMLDLLERGKFKEATKILLEFYYDPLYEHTLKRIKFEFEVSNENIDQAISDLKSKLKKIKF